MPEFVIVFQKKGKTFLGDKLKENQRFLLIQIGDSIALVDKKPSKVQSNIVEARNIQIYPSNMLPQIRNNLT